MESLILLPQPRRLNMEAGRYRVEPGKHIALIGAPAQALFFTGRRLAQALRSTCGMDWTITAAIANREQIGAVLRVAPALASAEAYELTVGADGDLTRQEFELAAQMLRHAARRGKLAFEEDAARVDETKLELGRDLEAILDCYTQLWHARNRPAVFAIVSQAWSECGRTIDDHMNEYIESNRRLWDAWTGYHVKSAFYDLEGFKGGRISLMSTERDALGDVTGKSLLHLQCHFGLDTMSWARLGARVTGVDFSAQAIRVARELSRELSIEADFVLSNIYDLPHALAGEFDIVFTSYGVLDWLPDLTTWAQVIAHFLRPGGTFYVIEFHPSARVFDDSDQVTDLRVCYPYFAEGPVRFEVQGSYADATDDRRWVEYDWQHPMGDIVNSLTLVDLRIQEIREYPFAAFRMFPFMEKGADGYWHLPRQFPQMPLMFSLRATK